MVAAHDREPATGWDCDMFRLGHGIVCGLASSSEVVSVVMCCVGEQLGDEFDVVDSDVLTTSRPITECFHACG